MNKNCLLSFLFFLYYNSEGLFQAENLFYKDFTMKKLTGIIAAFLIAGIFFSGCTPEDKDLLLGPENTWCKTDLSYKNADGETEITSLDVWVYYTDSEKTENGTTLKPGPTVVLACKNGSNTTLSKALNGYYVMKTFEKGSSDPDLEGLNWQSPRAAWTALYLAKADFRKSANQKDKNPLFSSGFELGDINDIKDNFSWKRLLASYLLS